jgi:hypothetical protein
MSTAATILDRAERTLDFERSSVGIPGLESTNLLTVVNAGVKEYFASFEKSGEPSSILRKETGYTLVTDTAVNNASGIASGATSIIGDSFASFGASGAVAVWDNDRPDYIEFGANNLTTTLSTVTGVSFAHEDDDIISLLYALPSNFDGFRSEEGYEDGVSVDGRAFFFTTGNPSGNKFAIYDNGTTKYLHFPQGLTGDVFVRYNSAPTVIDAEGDTIDIPVKDEDYAMWKVVQYAAPKLDRQDMYQIATQEMLKILNSAHVRKNIGKRPRLRPFRFGKGLSRSQVFDG